MSLIDINPSPDRQRTSAREQRRHFAREMLDAYEQQVRRQGPLLGITQDEAEFCRLTVLWADYEERLDEFRVRFPAVDPGVPSDLERLSGDERDLAERYLDWIAKTKPQDPPGSRAPEWWPRAPSCCWSEAVATVCGWLYYQRGAGRFAAQKPDIRASMPRTEILELAQRAIGWTKQAQAAERKRGEDAAE